MATLTRVFEFDAAHRVMHEKVKCFNLHGHRFRVEVTFEYHQTSRLGYAIDFRELKRIAGNWIDSYLDHAAIFNPLDKEFIELNRSMGLRTYVMGMGVIADINPSAETIAEEMLYTLRVLFSKHPVIVKSVKLYETPNCWVEVDCTNVTPTMEVDENLMQLRDIYGIVNYDERED